MAVVSRNDIEVAKAHGLPDDWMLVVKLQDKVSLEKESNQKIILLAQQCHGSQRAPLTRDILLTKSL